LCHLVYSPLLKSSRVASKQVSFKPT